MLSEYGETLAGVLKQIRDEDNAKLQQSAKELDDLFEEEQVNIIPYISYSYGTTK